jgi:hypothetical protein
LQATAQTSNFVNFEFMLDTVIYGAELGAVIYGVELTARSSVTLNRATKLDAVSYSVETCNLNAMNHDVDPQGPKLSLLRPRI